jgi:hypothetical protein
MLASFKAENPGHRTRATKCEIGFLAHDSCYDNTDKLMKIIHRVIQGLLQL